ncbi:MAG: tetratricopeptide repeat protein [Pseudomonadota bacterium]
MSYIHDALRKAQREKDAANGYLQPVVSIKRKKRYRSIGKKIILTVAGLLICAATIIFCFDRGDEPIVSSSLPQADIEKQPEGTPGETQEDVEILYEIAMRDQESGSMESAKRIYTRIMEMSPDFVPALNNMGVIYMSEGNDSKAREFFDRVVQINPRYVDACYNLACLYAKMGNLLASERFLKSAYELDGQVKEWADADKDLAILRSQKVYGRIFQKSSAAAVQGLVNTPRMDSSGRKIGGLAQDERTPYAQ